ncbi:hypothetical protein [Polaromonas sp.]
MQLHTVPTAFVHLPHTFGLYFQSQRFKAILVLEPHIRLMVDVLLTMNEAFCRAGGGVSCFSLLANKQGISEKTHDRFF